MIISDFLLYALLAGLGVAVVAGPLGCFVVWRRMAYFGDTLAHSALLGIALGVILDININVTLIILPLVIAIVLVNLEQRASLSLDSLLGIISHSALAAGLILIALLSDVRIDLMSLLFGDLLAVTKQDLWIIYCVSAVAVGLLLALWKPLISMTVDQELATIEGHNVKLLRTALMLITAMVIAIAMKIVGILLITALLIIPAAAASKLSETPEQMAVLAGSIATLSVALGLAMSWYLDTPAGPSVVISASCLFGISQVVGRRTN